MSVDKPPQSDKEYIAPVLREDCLEASPRYRPQYPFSNNLIKSYLSGVQRVVTLRRFERFYVFYQGCPRRLAEDTIPTDVLEGYV